MNPKTAAFTIICAILIFALNRRTAPIAVLIGSLYMTSSLGVKLGFNFPVYRILLIIGFLRTLVRQEKLEGQTNPIDKLMIVWGVWTVFASFFHEQAAGSGPVYAGGVVLDVLLVYFLIRIWCRNLDDTRHLVILTAWMLAPIALEMVTEKLTGQNRFSIFGGVDSNTMIREGKLRASGPFLHPILAGTVGANSLPLMIGLYRSNRFTSILGIAVCVAMVLSCASSGPIMSLATGVAAVAVWRIRQRIRAIQIIGILCYFIAGLAMGQPGYYILSRINLTGSSTGYHRARLIESSIEHLPEWWLFGTDYTRHWMATGVSYSPNHTDITNYYLGFGVIAGIPAILLIVGALWKSFGYIGKRTRLRIGEDAQLRDAFFVWCIGASLLAHATTGISVAYFDQSMVIFWLTVALASSQSNRLIGTPIRRHPEPSSEKPQSANPHF